MLRLMVVLLLIIAHWESCNAELFYISAEGNLSLMGDNEELSDYVDSLKQTNSGINIMAGITPLSILAIEMEGRLNNFDLNSIRRMDFRSILDIYTEGTKELDHMFDSPMVNGAIRLNMGPVGLFTGMGIPLNDLLGMFDLQGRRVPANDDSSRHTKCENSIQKQTFYGIKVGIKSNFGIFARLTRKFWAKNDDGHILQFGAGITITI